MSLPSNADERKARPLYSGVLMYFPDAIAEVAFASYTGNEQHHPGAPLHWDKSKSTDEADCLVRHLMQAGTRDSDGVRHTAKVAWRALALLQRELDSERDQSPTQSGTEITGDEDWLTDKNGRWFRAPVTPPHVCSYERYLNYCAECGQFKR